MNSLLGSRPSLFNNLQRVALVLLRARRAQHRAQGTSDAAGTSNHLAEVALGDFQFDDGLVAVLIFVHEDFARGIDERLGDVLNQRPAR